MKQLHSHRKNHQGVSLIEVLITVLILTSGLLGMAALQTRSLNFNNIAYLNTRADMMAYDMLDRIKANRAYSVNSRGYIVSLGNIPSSYPITCESNDCTPQELSVYDIDQWKFTLDQQLPDGDGTISIADTPEGRVYTISVFFDDSRGSTTRRQIIIRSIL
ncbi:type IV pilus modification protein PilV [Endozoicomonas sp. (ex Bugula neritina AB1)]|nr:type IV pilus modification protein PilV [Endozoicomonas sp. (ex Bugula neritina AB1)]